MEEGLGQNSVPPSGSIDKSRILDIKPLRCLIPVFPISPQPPPSGQYPSGYSPFFPFGAPQTARDGAIPAPIRAFRSPLGAGDTSSTMEGFNDHDISGNKKHAASRLNRYKSSIKKYKTSQESHIDLSALVNISPAQREDGIREVVDITLMTFDALRRRLCQLEDAKELSTGSIKRADLRACKILMTKGIRTNMRKRIGFVPGVEIGDIFFFRTELCIVGLHAPSMGGIDSLHIRGESEEETMVAISIVSSGEYDDDAEDNDVIIYTGQGGNSSFNKKDKVVMDQKLHRGNLALDNSSRLHNEVRVIRGMRDAVNPNAKIYVYDGLYQIQNSWVERAKNGGDVFKYKLVRMPGQPSAFSVWKSVQKWKSGSPSRTGLILADLSAGAESIPVSLVNDVDNVKAPAYFTYFHSLRHPKSFSLTQPSNGCNCAKACVPGDLNCSCIRRNEGDFPYTGNGILVSRKQMVHECGPTCQCFPNCKNRVSQTGLKLYMEVFKTKDRGWGLRSLDAIRAGTFICEYAGEVIDRDKVSHHVKERYNDEYVFDTTCIYDPFKWNYEPKLLEEVSTNDTSEDYAIPYPLIISAKNVGNVARFMNHSCSPNVFWQPVLYEENNQSFLHVAFFALRHIPPMTELTYDYGFARSDHAEGSSAPKGRNKCLCGSSKCHGSFG
ncbi:histone-lysine N-methyltransferase, H3 lysine-9 specific SUVH1-like [Gastrolobium bilobum]|uniref:histone-lysine N-methyltransferase, H3 lysine-9 specific SUVH1-like n=1 Tax=Gastrolobium bilobum TaxID=150636 RepID=UPI002AAF9DDB|nr:histone-lysine N-methyltransferase, H3 lysine-9 specific SUVH1-like [Gastrolobium bilobum]